MAVQFEAEPVTGELHLQELLGTLPIAVYVTDAQGRLTYFNRAASALSGRVPQLGSDKWCASWKIFDTNGTPVPNDQSPMATALQGKDSAAGQEYIAERPDGSRFWFTPYLTVLKDARGRTTGVMNVLIDVTARKVAEAETHALFGTIFDTTPECVKVVSPDGTLLRMNAAGLSMIGATSGANILGRSVYDLAAPEDRDRFREFNEAICRGETGSLEFVMIGLDGRRHQMETHAAPLAHDGTTVQLAVTRDVSGRKNAERAAQLLSAIVDSSDDAIISNDLNGIVMSWNRGAERLFGFTAAEAIGQSVSTLLTPADRMNEEPDILSRIQQGERVDHFETKRKSSDGTLRDISLTISPVKDPHERIIGASRIARDIGERKLTQRAGLLLGAIVDSSEDAIISKDLNGVITSWNRSAERLFGYTAAEAIGQSVASLLIPDDRQDEEPDILSRLRRGERVDHFETKRRRKDGILLDISLTISPVKDPSGKIIGASKIARDITEQVRSQNALRESIESLNRSNADLEQFAYSASHDLQEPLRMVCAYSEILQRKFSGQLGQTGDEYIGYLIEGATRMDQLLRDLRAYTYASLSNEGPPPVVSAASVLDQTLAILRAAIDESIAQITAVHLPDVKIHDVQLKQLFLNLIGNAIRYRSGERPEIAIGAEPDGSMWRFFVRDNGIGIDPAYKEHVFGIFKRLHTSSQYPGTGMGLAICQRIVERAGGRIWVESEPGRGSTFFFTLQAGG